MLISNVSNWANSSRPPKDFVFNDKLPKHLYELLIKDGTCPKTLIFPLIHVIRDVSNNLRCISSAIGCIRSTGIRNAKRERSMVQNLLSMKKKIYLFTGVSLRNNSINFVVLEFFNSYFTYIFVYWLTQLFTRVGIKKS